MNNINSTLYLGSPGCGKSYQINNQIKNISNKDKIYLIDELNEYKIDGNNIILKNDSNTIINPFDLYFFDNCVLYKFNFIKSLLEHILNETMSSILEDKIYNIVKNLYNPYILYLKENNINIDRNKCPTFNDFYNLLFNSNDEELSLIASSIQVFCNGTIKTFCGHTNVNMESNITIYNTYNMGHTLANLCTMICLEDIRIRLEETFNLKVKSFIFLDNAERIFVYEKTAKYFEAFLKQERISNVDIILAVQFFSFITNNEYSKHIIKDIDKFILYHQETSEAKIIEVFLNLDDAFLNKTLALGVGEKIELCSK